MKNTQTEPWFAEAVASRPSQKRPVDPQGCSARFGDSFVYYAGIPNAAWMVFGSARAEVLPGGLTADRLQAMWIGVALAVTGGMVILLTKLVMLRPLRQLERHAMRLLGNDMVVEDGWPDGRGELGRLARVFQHVMRERVAIQKSGDELVLKMQAVMSNAAVGIAFTRLSQLVRSGGSRFWTRRQGAPVRAGDISAGRVCRWVSTGAWASSKSSPRGWTSRR